MALSSQVSAKISPTCKGNGAILTSERKNKSYL